MKVCPSRVYELGVPFHMGAAINLPLGSPVTVNEVVIYREILRRNTLGHCDLEVEILAGNVASDDDILRVRIINIDSSTPGRPSIVVKGIVDHLNILHWVLALRAARAIDTDRDTTEPVVVSDVVVYPYIFKQATHLRSHDQAIAVRDVMDNVLENVNVVRVLILGVHVNADSLHIMHVIPINSSIITLDSLIFESDY